jgi:hypothetical protein
MTSILIKADQRRQFRIQHKCESTQALLGSMFPGQLTIVSAPTGTGKTTYALDQAANERDQGIRSVYWNGEQPEHEMKSKYAASYAHLDWDLVLEIINEPAAALRAEMWEALGTYAQENYEAGLKAFEPGGHMDHVRLLSGRKTVAELNQVMREMEKNGEHHLWIDHLGYVTFEGRGDRRSLMGVGLQEWKDEAINTSVHVTVLSQFNRDGSNTGPKYAKPELNRIADSADIERIAWYVAVITPTLRMPFPEKEEFAAVARGEASEDVLLEPNSATFWCLKHRSKGRTNAVGRSVRLVYRQGKYEAPDPAEEQKRMESAARAVEVKYLNALDSAAERAVERQMSGVGGRIQKETRRIVGSDTKMGQRRF